METNKIYHGNAYELITQLPDKSVDLIYTDIPYDIVNGGKGAGLLKDKARNLLYEKTIGHFSNGIDYKILDEFARVMKHIYVYIWCNKEQLLPLMKFFVDEKGCIFDLLVWVKTNCTPFSNNTYLPNLEYCLLFREPGFTSLNHNSASDSKKKYYLSGTNVSDKKNYLHPTIKPLSFVENHISNSTKPNDVVLDPFMGSGTTAVACKALNRKYIGFEINEDYYKASLDRLNGINIYGQTSILDTDFDLFN